VWKVMEPGSGPAGVPGASLNGGSAPGGGLLVPSSSDWIGCQKAQGRGDSDKNNRRINSILEVSAEKTIQPLFYATAKTKTGSDL